MILPKSSHTFGQISLFVGTLFLANPDLQAQKDTVQHLQTVQIMRERDSIYLIPRMLSVKGGSLVAHDEIERKRPIDLGELTRSFPGVFLKSYGGVGGMKTINARGLGSQHFLVLINGISYLQNQSGSANLGNIQTDFIETVKYSTGGADEWLLPPISRTYAGVIQVFTSEQLFISNKSKVEVSLLGGSFGHYKTSLNTYFSKKNFYLAANGYGMSYQGNYPYSYTNGYQPIQAIRANNNVGEGAFRFGAGYQTQQHRFQVEANYYKSTKQLPGAIIFYQPANHQSLDNINVNVALTHTYFSKRISQRNTVSWNEGNTHYLDPYFIGNSINQHYSERTIDVSHTAKKNLDKAQHIQLTWGGQYLYTELLSDASSVQHPQRHRGFLTAGISLHHTKWTLESNFPLQLLTERTRLTSWKNTFLFTPSLGFSRRFILGKSNWNFHSNYASTARVASFNELYFGKSQIVQLKPEKSNMGDIGFASASFLPHHFSYQFSTSGFAAWISDKIITLPTKNLFVWSVFNLGKVLSYGFNADVEFKKMWKNEKIQLSTVHKTGLTVSKDYTDKKSSTYKQQIPYTPYWNYSGELIFLLYGVELSWQSSYNGFRFVLGENTYPNLLNDYWLHDARISYLVFTKNKVHHFRIYFKMNNITNKQYQVIRSFPMPGRSFEVGVKYGWNKQK